MANIAFNPANATMMNLLSGTIPVEFGQDILKDVMSNSLIMQLGKYEPMAKQSKIINVLTGGPAAYWVDEGERIRTSKPTWKQVTMTSKKLGVILPVSREYLQYSQRDFFNIMRPYLAEALYKKFDAEAILGTDSVFGDHSLAGVLLANNSTVAGDFSVENYTRVVGLLNDRGYEPNGFISKVANASLLRGLIRDADGMKTRVYDAGAKSLDGVPVFDLSNDITAFSKGTLIAGDWNQIRYGIPYNMSYMISQDATLTTIVQDGHTGMAGAGDATPLNLFEREMIAVRVTMDVAFMIVDGSAFAQLAHTPVDGSVAKTYIVGGPTAGALTVPAEVTVATQPDTLEVTLDADIAAAQLVKLTTSAASPVKLELTVPGGGWKDGDKLVYDWSVSPPTVKLTAAASGHAVTDVTATVKTASGKLADFKVKGGETITPDPVGSLLKLTITA